MSRRDNRGGDLPLIAWGEALRRRKRQRHRFVAAAMVGPLIGLVIVSIACPPHPRLVWNASASVPIGLYRVTPDATPVRGAMVVARVPSSVQRLAASRRYVPANVPLVKHVGAVPGDTVCAIGSWITIDGQVAATRRAIDGRKRPMPWWTGCVRLRRGEVFLLSPAAPDSFDGRYFGVSSSADIVGTARPLWRR